MSEFYEIEPSLENYWRAVILFGRNVASYKFALAKSLYELQASSGTVITLDQLAAHFLSPTMLSQSDFSQIFLEKA